jgi:hypothetical protein
LVQKDQAAIRSLGREDISVTSHGLTMHGSAAANILKVAGEELISF